MNEFKCDYGSQDDSIFSYLKITCICGYVNKWEWTSIDGLTGYTCKECGRKYVAHQQSLIVRERLDDDIVYKYNEN